MRRNNNSLSDLSRRRPRRRAKQQVYSERYRRKLAAANCPDRGDIAAAVLRTMMPIWAKNWQWWHERFFPRLCDDLEAKGFDRAAAAAKVQAMVHADLNRIERQGVATARDMCGAWPAPWCQPPRGNSGGRHGTQENERWDDELRDRAARYPSEGRGGSPRWPGRGSSDGA